MLFYFANSTRGYRGLNVAPSKPGEARTCAMPSPHGPRALWRIGAKKSRHELPICHSNGGKSKRNLQAEQLAPVVARGAEISHPCLYIVACRVVGRNRRVLLALIISLIRASAIVAWSRAVNGSRISSIVGVAFRLSSAEMPRNGNCKRP